MNTVLRALGALFLFGALTEAVEAQSLGRILAGLAGLFLTSMALVFGAIATGLAFSHPMATNIGLLLINALGVANLVRQANPASGLISRSLVAGISTVPFTMASAYALAFLVALFYIR